MVLKYCAPYADVHDAADFLFFFGKINGLLLISVQKDASLLLRNFSIGVGGWGVCVWGGLNLSFRGNFYLHPGFEVKRGNRTRAASLLSTVII